MDLWIWAFFPCTSKISTSTYILSDFVWTKKNTWTEMKNPAVLYLISREFLELSITRKGRHQTATEIMLRSSPHLRRLYISLSHALENVQTGLAIDWHRPERNLYRIFNYCGSLRDEHLQTPSFSWPTVFSGFATPIISFDKIRCGSWNLLISNTRFFQPNPSATSSSLLVLARHISKFGPTVLYGSFIAGRLFVYKIQKYLV